MDPNVKGTWGATWMGRTALGSRLSVSSAAVDLGGQTTGYFGRATESSSSSKTNGEGAEGLTTINGDV